MSEFGDAFKKARQSGLSTFEYKGKKYGTRLAGESKEAHAKYLKSKSQLGRDIMQNTGKDTGYRGEMKPVKPVARKKEETVSLPAKKAPSVIGASKPAPKKADSKAPRSGSAVSQTRQNEDFIKGMKEEAVAKQASRDNAKKSSAEVSKFVPSKPKAVVKEDMRESYKKERSVRGRKESAQDYERFKAMKGYAATRKKVKGVADKYKDVLARAAKIFEGGGSLKEVPAGAKGLSKLPAEVRNKMGFRKDGGKMPKYGYGGKMKKK